MANRRFRFLLLSLSLVLLIGNSAVAQFNRGTQMTFGKNRVQYTDFLWTYNRFTNFDTYFYVGGQELAIYTGRTADKEIEEIEKLFDYRINGRFQFIIFNKLSDLKQSNIGLEGTEQGANTGGLTHINGTKVLLYFDGDYRHLREQIRAGVAQVMINQLMYGGSFKNRVQSAVLLNIPEWYLHGLVSYVAKGWTTEEDNKMRDGINSGRFKKYNTLATTDPDFAGQSLWNYVIENYGSTSVSNLLYMTRINRNIESGFIYVIGVSLNELSHNWLDYYKRSYAEDDKNRLNPSGKPVFVSGKSNRIINEVKVSPDGTQLAYVTNDRGKYKVWLYDTRNNKRKKLAKGGYKSASQPVDASFPVIAWHPTGRYLTAIKEKKGKLWMDYYTPKKWGVKREKNKFFYFEKVLDFSYSSTGTEIVMSAVQKGQSDIYTFNLRTKTYQQITKDRWDDSHAHYVMGDRFIAFSSNRTEDSLKTTSFKQAGDLITSPQTDIFLFNTISRSPLLLQLTNTPAVNETDPMMLDSNRFTYLSNANGITNRYLASIDSTISYIDTVIHYRYIVDSKPQSNYQRNIISQDINSHQSRLAELTNINNRYAVYMHPLSEIDSTYKSPLPKTALRFKIDRTTALPVPKIIRQDATITLPEPVKVFEESKPEETQVADSNKIDINNYEFQSEFPKKKKKQSHQPVNEKPVESTITSTPVQVVDSLVKAVKAPDSSFYWVPKQRNYDPAFSVNYLVTQLDNSFFNETYQKYTGGAVYTEPGLNLLIMLGVNDLMDDYKITGGFRLSFNLNNNEYYLSFENLKHRLDRQITFYRQSREEVTDISLLKIQTHEVKYLLKWPFSEITSLRGSVAYRNDRTAVLSTDINNLKVPNTYENWTSAHLEYVFDNTISTGLNLYNGLRFKLFAEGFKQIVENNKDLYVLGADFRYYVKVHRQIIWANRFATGTTFGSSKMVYYMGSVDNTFAPANNFNPNIQVDQTQHYAFQALATNMRGFTQNIRNGSSFALINSEIRIPVFQYIYNKPIRSEFKRNFQIIGFGDIGSAWNGSSPYNKNNALYNASYPGNPISINVTKNVEPIVGGYGFGLRSSVLGYFLRADWAWGVDDGVVQPRIFYFSLGLDF